MVVWFSKNDFIFCHCEQFTSFGKPEFGNPIITNWPNTIHTPSSKAEFIVH